MQVRAPAASLAAILVRPGTADNLAAVRIVCTATVFLTTRPDRVFEAASRPLPVIPADVAGSLLLLLPRSDSTILAASAVLTVSLVAAMVGLWGRPALALAAASSAYVLGLANSFGKVDHNHHLVWVLIVLAAAPCDHALNIRSRRPPRIVPATAYGTPVRVLWLLIGMIYFFPGLWKLLVVGPSWALSSNLRNIIWSERLARGGYEPVVDLASSSVIYQSAALGVLVFELTFVLLVFSKLRHVALCLGVVFHLGTDLAMGISFTSLLLLYPVFLDWSRTIARLRLGATRLARLRPAHQPRPRITPAGRVSGSAGVAVQLALLVAVSLAGATRTLDGWPVASYPDFAYRASDEFLVVTLESGSGRPVELPGSSLQTHRLLGRAWTGEHALSELRGLLAASTACEELERADHVLLRLSTYRVDDAGIHVSAAHRSTSVMTCP